MIISEKTSVYAIVGSPVGHSLSPAMHNAAYAQMQADAIFVSLAGSNFKEAVNTAKKLGIRGLAVTAPFKMDALPFCNKVEPRARKIGAINTVLLGDTIEGFNTDVDGVALAIEKAGQSIRGKTVTIIGAGGAARGAIGAVLKEEGTSIRIIVRNTEKAEKDLRHVLNSISLPCTIEQIESEPAKVAISESEILINTIPGDLVPLDIKLLNKGQIVFDAVYKPGGTKLIKAAKNAGCIPIAGQEMLIKQAQRQFEIFTGQKAPEIAMREALAKSLQGHKPARIVLIGARGSGKSSTATALAKQLALTVFSTDQMIENVSGMKISELVETKGWEAFRDLEQKVIESIHQGNSIIDCGGGVVKRKENREALKAGSFVVYLRGSADVLAGRIGNDDTRPALILATDPKKEMELILKKREPLYLETSGLVIDTDQRTPEVVAKMIAAEYSSR